MSPFPDETTPERGGEPRWRIVQTIDPLVHLEVFRSSGSAQQPSGDLPAWWRGVHDIVRISSDRTLMGVYPDAWLFGHWPGSISR